MRRQKMLLPVVALLLLLTAGAVVWAQTAAGFDLVWNVIAGGGGRSSSADYRVEGTIGQAVAGPPAAGSADFMIGSGYWFGATGGAATTLYVPVIHRTP